MLATAQRFVVPGALSLLPKQHDTPEARAMLVAIGLQESEFTARRQVTRSGVSPARGFWQFEVAGGTAEVLTNPTTRPLCEAALMQLRYPPAASACWEAFEHNDLLACVFARLLLLTSPHPNPGPDNPMLGFRSYVQTWRPGAWARGSVLQRTELEAKWSRNFRAAWSLS